MQSQVRFVAWHCLPIVLLYLWYRLGQLTIISENKSKMQHFSISSPGIQPGIPIELVTSKKNTTIGETFKVRLPARGSYSWLSLSLLRQLQILLFRSKLLVHAFTNHLQSDNTKEWKSQAQYPMDSLSCENENIDRVHNTPRFHIFESEQSHDESTQIKHQSEVRCYYCDCNFCFYFPHRTLFFLFCLFCFCWQFCQPALSSTHVNVGRYSRDAALFDQSTGWTP